MIDNLILVHNIDSKITIVYDIKGQKELGTFPVASPLPLSVQPYLLLFIDLLSFFLNHRYYIILTIN